MIFAAGHVILTVALAQLRLSRRYPGLLLVDAARPLMMSLVPVFLGRALGGADAYRAFKAQVGVDDPRCYVLLGTLLLSMTSGVLWNLGFWVRREMQSGTLTANYLCPVPRAWLLAGTALHGFLRDIVIFLVSFAMGVLLFRIELQSTRVLSMLALILFSTLPLYGLGVLYATAVLRLKEARALTMSLQWLATLLVGASYPIAVLPRALRYLALLFPATWSTNAARAAFFGAGWLLDHWYFDMAIIALHASCLPVLGATLFTSAERKLLRGEGIGAF